ncbi:MAG: nucleotidyltransferase domain-containing protein [Bacteroidetes bacterium]|nr:nucleotidyltransferase domain-containing protein [Bacteroidota bacterium]
MSKNEKNILGLIKSKVLGKDAGAEIILFGSHARGEAGKNSDWDILILLNQPNVTRVTEKEFMDELFEVELEVGESISTFVFSKKDWEQRHSVTPLYQNIKRDGVRI